jgi:hypothetical protein
VIDYILTDGGLDDQKGCWIIFGFSLYLETLNHLLTLASTDAFNRAFSIWFLRIYWRWFPPIECLRITSAFCWSFSVVSLQVIYICSVLKWLFIRSCFRWDHWMRFALALNWSSTESSSHKVIWALHYMTC